MADPRRLLAGLARDGVPLDLSTLDLCFLAGLSLRAERDGLASLDEELFLDTFEQVCDLVEPDTDNKRKRATHAVQRLRDQRLLARVDATGIVSAGGVRAHESRHGDRAVVPGGRALDEGVRAQDPTRIARLRTLVRIRRSNDKAAIEDVAEGVA